MKILDRIPFTTLVVLGAFLMAAPFVPEPHLWQKLKMLGEGTLTKPLDIFDVFWHSWPLLLIALKLVRMRQIKGETKS